MKKVLSLAIALCLLISSLSAALIVPVSASTGTDYFESLSNWGIYSDEAPSTDENYIVATNYDGETCQTKAGWCYIRNDTAQDADSTGKSIKIHGNTFNVAVNLPTLKANTGYTLSFKYKPGDGTTVSSSGTYFTSHIIKKGTAFNSGKSGPAEFIADLGKGTETSDWQEISVDFTTADTTDYMLEFRFAFKTGYDCFLDGFTLKYDFESLSNWKAITGSNSPGTKNLPDYPNGTELAASGAWNKVSENTTADYISEGDKSIKLYGNANYFYIMLPDLKANSKYTLTFKYYADYVNSNGNKVFEKLGIYNPNAEDATLESTASYVAMAPKTATAKTWNDVTLEFKTDDNTEFALLANIALGGKPDDVEDNQYTAFLDDFTLTELTPKTITFNTNCGSEIEPLKFYAGEPITMPENPTKEDYAFAGWYTDADLTNRFTATTFPAEDITLYAKWIEGFSYQDFENYTATPSGKSTVLTDGKNAYSGNGYLKYSASEADAASGSASGCFVVSDEALKDFATPGDQIKISLKYKLLSGDAKFYMHTSSTANKVTINHNVYVYEKVNLTVLEDWQELTVTYNLKSDSKITAEGFTVDDFLYSVLFLVSTTDTELYIDDITLDVIPLIKVKTAYNNASALRSADASSTGQNGLRIYNSIEKSWVNTARIVEYGSIAISKDTLNDEELKLETTNVKTGVAYKRGETAMKLWDTTEKKYIFTTYLFNIPEDHYGKDYSIRTYAKDYQGNIYYGRVFDISVFEVANEIDNSPSPSDVDKAAFESFVNDGTKDAYSAWCEANTESQTVGTLYNTLYPAQ